MRIFYVTDSLFPSYSANSIQVIKMCESLSELNHKVSLYCIKSRTYINDAGLRHYYGVNNKFKIRLLKVNITPYFTLFFAFKALILLWNNKADLLITRSIYVALLFLVNENTRSKIVIELHSPSTNNILKKYIVKILLKKCHVVVISNALKIYFESISGSKIKNILVAPNAASVNNFANKTYTDHKFRVGYVGSHYRGRGVDFILKLAKYCPWANFVLVGNTHTHDTISFDEIPNNVEIIGHVSPNQCDELRSKCDVLIAPYEEDISIFGGRSENYNWMSPLKIFDYMASKRPMIVSDIPVLQEILTDRTNVLFCSINDLEEWITAIELIYSDTAIAKKLASNAHLLFLAKYTWKIRSQTILEHFI